MAHIEIPNHLLGTFGHPISMDLHVVNVKLRDGRRFRNLAVRDGRFITGRADTPNGESELDFSGEDIVRIRRAFWWPLFGTGV